MNWSNPRSVEAKVSRLTREIAGIDQFFYRGNENEDSVLYAGMLERKRDDMVRSAVLQMHTAIEDILNSQIIGRILNVKPEERSRKMRSNSARALRKMLFGAGSIGFDMKLNFAVALGLLNAKTKDKLMTLNTLAFEIASETWKTTETKEAATAFVRWPRSPQCRCTQRVRRGLRCHLCQVVRQIPELKKHSTECRGLFVTAPFRLAVPRLVPKLRHLLVEGLAGLSESVGARRFEEDWLARHAARGCQQKLPVNRRNRRIRK